MQPWPPAPAARKTSWVTWIVAVALGVGLAWVVFVLVSDVGGAPQAQTPSATQAFTLGVTDDQYMPDAFYVTLALRENSGVSWIYVQPHDFRLTDGDGRVYPREAALEPQFPTVRIYPGESATGWIQFGQSKGPGTYFLEYVASDGSDRYFSNRIIYTI